MTLLLCGAGQPHGSWTALRKSSFHWGKASETRSQPQRKSETTNPPEKVYLSAAEGKGTVTRGGELLPTSTQNTAVQHRKAFEQEEKTPG